MERKRADEITILQDRKGAMGRRLEEAWGCTGLG